MNLLICDDHPVIINGLRNILSNMQDVASVSGAKNSQEAITFLKQEKFNIAVIDLSLKDSEMNGMELLSYIKRKYPETKVLIYTMQAAELAAMPAMRAGASGYLTKDAETDQVIEAIRTIRRGLDYVSEAVGRLLLQQVNEENKPADHNKLSTLEFQVLTKTGNGKTLQEIADETGHPYKSVSRALRDMMDKMGFKKKSEITPYCLKHNLMDAS
jgi:two-component system, NarL family, invasion response regulator UvrY